MNSRNLIFVFLLCALVLFVSTTLAAEKTPNDETNKENEVQQPDQFAGGGRCRYGCCGRGLYGQCRRCCRTESEASTMSVDLDGYGGGGWGGGGGRGGGGWGGGGGGHGGGGGGGHGGGGWGGGGGGHGGGGWGGGGGGHCRYGCCGGYGRYCRCCYNAEEAHAVQGEN